MVFQSNSRTESIEHEWFEQFYKILKKTSAIGSVLNKAAALDLKLYSKMISSQIFLREFCDILQNIHFLQHNQATDFF